MVALPIRRHPAADWFPAEPAPDDALPDAPDDAFPDAPDDAPADPPPDAPDPPVAQGKTPPVRGAGALIGTVMTGGTEPGRTRPQGAKAQVVSGGPADRPAPLPAPAFRHGRVETQFAPSAPNGSNDSRVSGEELTRRPAASMAVRVPMAAPELRLAGNEPASTAHPPTGAIVSVPPPWNDTRVCVTVGPVATMTTAAGAPSAWPTNSLSEAVTG